jgi:hypothetical protein
MIDGRRVGLLVVDLQNDFVLVERWRSRTLIVW